MAQCVHGFEQSECLICSTLARSGGQPASTTAVADRAAAPNQASNLTNGLGRPLPEPRASQPLGASDGRSGRAGGLGAGSKLAIAIVVVLGGLLAWSLFQGIFSLMLHIFEYVVVAIIAGWAGYKAGHYRARHEARDGRRKRGH